VQLRHFSVGVTSFLVDISALLQIQRSFLG